MRPGFAVVKPTEVSVAAEPHSHRHRHSWLIRLRRIRETGTVLAAHHDATVIELGCGLDTSFSRIDNGRLRWYDLDLPEVIDFSSGIARLSQWLH